jgi:hypothetical protein
MGGHARLAEHEDGQPPMSRNHEDSGFFGAIVTNECDLLNRTGCRGCWYINPARRTISNELNSKTCHDN